MSKVYNTLHKAPHKPGVYLMKDGKGSVFYIGKAKDLHKRMHQYITPASDGRAFVQILDRILGGVDFFITASEKEALILENNLIKRHRPYYNVRVKDDSTFFSLRLDNNEDFPKLELVRRRRKDKALYFGPYSSAKKARGMLQLINKHFNLRDCSERVFSQAKRPCLRQQMGRCPAPCSLEVSREDYHAELRRVRMFLEGKKDLLLAELKPLMEAAAEKLDYERAARIRDQIAAVTGSLEKQVMVLPKMVNWDVVGFHREGESAAFAVLQIRNGRITARDTFHISCRALSDGAAVSGFVTRHYEKVQPLPELVLLPEKIEDAAVIGEWMSDRRGRRVEIQMPERGDKARLVKIARENARLAYNQHRSRAAERERELESLRKILSLDNFPRRVECVDISNIQGRLAVGSLVCFIDGEAEKSQYRRYRIKTLDSPDDFGMMRELLIRRFKRGKDEGVLPDLLVVDGGKGQLNILLAVLGELEISGVDAIGLAKSRLKNNVGGGRAGGESEGGKRRPERIFLPKIKNPVILKPGAGELHLLQRLRDEAHRSAITYHRKLRSKANLRSGLMDIPGIGPKRARRLLAHFGSLKRVRAAKPEEIAELSGFNLKMAGAILERLGRSDS